MQVMDAGELTAVQEVRDQPVVVAVAAFFGTVRLIDNIEIDATQH